MTELAEQTATTATPLRPRRLHWWHEVLFVLIFYGVYSAVRNTQGSATASVTHALNNARHIIRWEEWLHIFNEHKIQHFFISHKTFMQFWNVYYGTAHFIVTTVLLIWLYRRMPERYPRWRNTLACTTGLALVGFALYPLMPPRLLNAGPPYGDHLNYGFVDSLRVIGGLWNFDSGTMQKISNQYAAMPSLHCAWAGWCTFVVWPGLKRLWSRLLFLLYPAATVFCIVVTANHYWLDAVGGAVVLSIGYVMGSTIANWRWRGYVPATASA